MVDVVLTYGKKKVKTRHAENWPELNESQFCDVVAYMHGKIDSSLLVNSLLRLKDPLINFPPEVIGLHDFIKDPFIEVLIKSIRINDMVLTGPQDQFRNVEIGQFAFGDTHYIKFLRNHDENELNKMIATFYLDKAYNQEETNDLADLISNVPARTKLAILFNYQIIRKWIFDRYGWLFPAAGEDTLRPSDTSLKGGKEPRSYWRKFMTSLINGDYVNQEKILKAKMHTVFYDMNERIKDQKKRKK